MRGSTFPHDISATPILGAYGWRDWRAVRKLLRSASVQNNHSADRTIPVPGAVRTIDAFVEELVASESEGGGVLPVQAGTRQRVSLLAPGEVALAADIVEMALEAAQEPGDTETRRDARAWLQDRSAIYSARVCFEALGIDYDMVRGLLLKRWLRQGGEK